MHNDKLLHLPVTIILCFNAMPPWKMDCHVFVLYSIYFAMACNCYMSIITLVSDLERYI